MVPESVTPPQPEADYSRAFERFVEDESDLVGLLGYALFKAHIREARQSGMDVALKGRRNPTTREVSAFRGQAESLLGVFANSMIDQAKDDLIRNEFGSELNAAKSEIVSALQNRTGFWTAVGAGLISWLLSLAILAIIAVTGIPDWLLKLSGHSGH